MNELEIERDRIEFDKWNKEGTTCNACGLYVKVYSRPLDKNMTGFLAWIVTEALKTGVKYHHYRSAPKLFADYSKLEMWGLIKPLIRHGADGKKNSGIWRPTKKGFNFLRGKISVPHHLFVFNHAVIQESLDQVYFKDCMSKTFDYENILNTIDILRKK